MAISKRRKFYPTVSVDGKRELDYLDSAIPSIDVEKMGTFVVKGHTIGRLDLISFFSYNSPDYGWLIAQVNDISDPWDDMFVGQVLEIPDITSYFDFYDENVS